MTDAVPALEVVGVSKQFNGIPVLKDISFSLGAGRVLGLVGQNGAGKSTLMKILAGVYTHDSGTIKVRGHSVSHSDPISALKNGIATIHQELSLCPNLTVVENMFLGNLSDNLLGVVNLKSLIERAQNVFAEMNININPKAIVSSLSLSQQQMVEIAKAYLKKPSILILDEPTSSLNVEEKKALYKVIEHLKLNNTSMIFVSHFLDEVLDNCDEVLVLRDGAVVNVGPSDGFTIEGLVSDMIDDKLNHFYPDVANRKKAEGRPVLTLKDVVIKRAGSDVGPISFSLNRGEIIGLAGLEGAGHEEVARCLAGLKPPQSGKVVLDGEAIRHLDSPVVILRKGINYVPSDRKTEGLVLPMTSYENASLPILDNLARAVGFLTTRTINRVSQGFLSNMKLAGNPQLPVERLSGGNQQKVVLAKMSNEKIKPKVLLLHDPTRGIDVKARSDIYNLIVGLAEQGVSILMVTSDLEEVVSMCDRIIMFRRGKSIELKQKFTSKIELQHYIESGVMESVSN
ncbi:sugar ABC transporter ATP-binding protein [Alicyclobacillus tolerans]|uniref:sugar ABC transporter ATP-binding protein n=1 Tax=Alicyclobacillus tolerans TaxID=90970 RepID=UPI001F23605F|nr:sugar ABC transporter ATP-binding protein [Alicyclobacillus tolerans]MCF8567358.1 sugar ABC transporter ATP-binding protein [Alicyclobacillus tolerans]